MMNKIIFLLISVNVFSQTLLPFHQDSLWGYKNEANEIIIQPEYQLAKKFYNDYAVVYKNDSAGLINKRNQVILPFKFNYLQYLSPNTFMYGFRAEYFGEFNSGIITLSGKKLTEPIYYNIDFIDNKYFVTTIKDRKITEGPLQGIRERETKYGVLDKNGAVIIPVIYDSSKSVDKDRIVMTEDKKNVNILFNEDGKRLTKNPFSSIDLYYDHLASVRIDRLCGFIDKKGEIAIPIVYSACYPFYKNKALVSQNFKFILIDKKANPLTEELNYEDMKNYLESHNLQIMFDEFRFMNRKK